MDRKRIENLIVIGLSLLLIGFIGYYFRWELSEIINEFFSTGWLYTVDIVILVSLVLGIGGSIIACSNISKIHL